MPENIVQLSFRLDEKLKRRFLAKVKGEGADIKEVLTSAVEGYLAPIPEFTPRSDQASVSPDVISSPFADLTDDQRRDVDALAEMLRAQDEELLPMVRRVLRIWRGDNAEKRAYEPAAPETGSKGARDQRAPVKRRGNGR